MKSAKTRRGGLAGGILILLLTSLAGGSLWNLFSARGIPWIEDWSTYIESKALEAGITLVTPAQAKAFFEEGRHIFLDARPAADFHRGHLPGAFSVPYENVEEAIIDIQMFLAPEQPIVTYCSGVDCDESFLLTEFLRNQGFTNVVLFAGGMEGWRNAGYEAEGGPR